MPAQTDFYDVDNFNENAEIIDKELSKMNRKLTLTFTAAGWSDTAPYTQLVAVEGITADDVPLPMLDTRNSTSLDDEKAIKKSYGYLTYFETGEGTITVTAKDQKPTVDLTVALKGV